LLRVVYVWRARTGKGCKAIPHSKSRRAKARYAKLMLVGSTSTSFRALKDRRIIVAVEHAHYV